MHFVMQLVLLNSFFISIAHSTSGYFLWTLVGNNKTAAILRCEEAPKVGETTL
jgi:hypothetical protein